MYRGLYKSKKKKVEFIKLVDPIPSIKEKDQRNTYKNLTQRGVHLFLNKNLVDKSATVDKGEFSKLLVNIIKKENTKRSKNKIYDFYSNEADAKKTTAIHQFYTPKLQESQSKLARHKNLLLMQVKNRSELNALKEYVSNRRTDSKLYERILRNILENGYKQLPEKNNLTQSYGYTFDEKVFMKYNFIVQKETNLQFVLDTLKSNYINANDKPKRFLSLSRERLKNLAKTEFNITDPKVESGKGNLKFSNVKKLRIESAIIGQSVRQKDLNVVMATIS
jgi:hypothetical protein